MLTIWCNTQFSGRALELLKEGTRGHRLIFSEMRSASPLAVGAPDPALATAEVALGQPDAEGVMQSARLRWVHVISAGYTRYDTDEFRRAAAGRGLLFSNSSSVFDEPCAEHVLAFMMANARRLDMARDVQRADRSWPTAPIREKSRLLLNPERGHPWVRRDWAQGRGIAGAVFHESLGAAPQAGGR